MVVLTQSLGCQVQKLLQGDLVPILHRVDKHQRPLLKTLLEMRAVAADWRDPDTADQDYKA
jgi:hypothetical protein